MTFSLKMEKMIRYIIIPVTLLKKKKIYLLPEVMDALVIFPHKELPSMGLVQMTSQHPPVTLAMCQDIITAGWYNSFRYI